MFYTKEVKLYKLEAIEDEWGIVGEEQYRYVKSVKVDIQPYSKDKLIKEYGYDLETTKRMFTDLDSDIDESTLVLYRGKPFRIVKVVEWDDYFDISLIDAKDVSLDDLLQADYRWGNMPENQAWLELNARHRWQDLGGNSK